MARLYGENHIAVGAESRIDAFTVITAGPGQVAIGARVHVGAAVQIFGSAGIVIEDFVNLSGRASLYSTSDDFTGGWAAGPLVPGQFRNVTEAPVVVRRHVIVGTGAVVLPGVELGWGSSVGALSLVRRNVEPGEVVAGVPAETVGRRSLAKLREIDELLASASVGDMP